MNSAAVPGRRCLIAADSGPETRERLKPTYSIPGYFANAFALLAYRRGLDLPELPEAATTSSDRRVMVCDGLTVEGLAKLIEQLWHHTDDDLFGMGSCPVPRGTLRLLASALIGAPNVGAAVRLLGQCERALPGLPAILLAEEPATATLTIDSRTDANPALTAVLLAITHRCISWAIDRSVHLMSVRVPHPAPAEYGDYQSMFGCEVEFMAPRAELVFDRRILAEPINRTHADIEALLRSAPQSLLKSEEVADSHAERVRRILRNYLGSESMSCDDIASMVGMSRQTLHRRLREENTSFLDLREQVICDEAIESLNRGDETVAALAARLGFSEPSAFTRAFRRWTGASPSAYRLARSLAVVGSGLDRVERRYEPAVCHFVEGHADDRRRVSWRVRAYHYRLIDKDQHDSMSGGR